MGKQELTGTWRDYSKSRFDEYARAMGYEPEYLHRKLLEWEQERKPVASCAGSV